MPAELDSCVSQVMAKGYPEDSAYAICRTSLDMSDEQGGDVMKCAQDIMDGKIEMPKGKMRKDYQDIGGVEIFSAGEWNGDKYTETDLNGIVSAFKETKDITKPYLKIGHNEKQKLLAEDELPAAGYVSRIYRSGKKILADFVNVPKKIYELIKNRAYSKVSSEIFVNFKSNGKTYPYALKAVALLGGATPAVHNLEEILNLYALGHTDAKTFEVESTKAYEFLNSQVNINTEDNTMTLEESMRQVAKLEAEVKSYADEAVALEKDLKLSEENLKTTQAELKSYKDKSESLEKEIGAIKQESFEKEVDAEIKSYADAGKIVPAQEPFLKALLKNAMLGGETKEFTIGEKKYADVKSLVKGFIDSHSEIEIDDEKSKLGGIPTDQGFVEKVNKYAKEKGVSIKEATLALSEPE